MQEKSRGAKYTGYRTALILGYIGWMAGAYAGLFGGRTEDRLLLIVLAAGAVIPAWRRKWLPAYGWLAFTVLLSMLYNTWADRSNQSGIDTDSPAAAMLEGIIASAVEVDGDRAVFVLEADRWNGGHLNGEKVRVTVRLKEFAEQETARGWRRGMRAEVRGELSKPLAATNFGAFDFREYLRRQGIHWQIAAEGADAVRAAGWSDNPAVTALRMLDELRNALHAQTGRLFPPEQHAWMSGILFGYRDTIDPERYKEFSEIGIAHILAISGMNVGLMLSILFWILLKAGCSKETARYVCMGFVPFYIALTGAEPPVVRAGLMAMIGLELMRTNRWKDSLPALCAAGWLMLLWHPYNLADVSYQLSFAVTAGLVIGVPRLYALLPAIPGPLRGLLAVTLTAQAVSLPLTLYYFNHVSWASLPANLILVPVIGSVLIPLGLASLFLSWIWIPAGQAAGGAAAWINDWLFRAVSGLNRLDPYGLNSISPPIWWMVLYYTGLFLLVSAWSRSRLSYETPAAAGRHAERRRFRLAAAASAAVTVCLMVVLFQPFRAECGGTVSFLDVGQGDAILVRTPGCRHLLIDTGGTIRFLSREEEWKKRRDPYEVGEDLLVPLLRKRGIQAIDYLILTHGDADHIGGARAVLEDVRVRRIVMNGTLRRQADAARLYRTALDRNIPIYGAQAGTRIQVDRHTSITVYHPAAGNELLSVSGRQNEVSLVFVLRMYDTEFLFTGDITSPVERAILERPLPAGDIEVLKVAHHGSKSSTSPEWLDAWDPEIAVISAGRNNLYGHPHAVVLERLFERDIAVYQTALNGEIRFRVFPDAMGVETAVKGNKG